MNASIARSRTRGSPRWREKTIMITSSSKPDIPLHELVYRLQYPWVGVYMQSNLKALRHTRKRPLYADGRRQLGGEPPMYSRSVVKIFYNKDIVSE
jgi:hypothetical protein